MKKYVCLMGVTDRNFGQRFYSMNDEGDPTKGCTGETWYKVLGYADTDDEARNILWSAHFPKAVQSER